jgi:hypothetical protein
MQPPASDRTPPSRLICTGCGARFDCNPGGDCWCADEALRLPLPAAGTAAQCICPTCLRAAATTAIPPVGE